MSAGGDAGRPPRRVRVVRSRFLPQSRVAVDERVKRHGCLAELGGEPVVLIDDLRDGDASASARGASECEPAGELAIESRMRSHRVRRADRESASNRAHRRLRSVASRFVGDVSDSPAAGAGVRIARDSNPSVFLSHYPSEIGRLVGSPIAKLAGRPRFASIGGRVHVGAAPGERNRDRRLEWRGDYAHIERHAQRNPARITAVPSDRVADVGLRLPTNNPITNA